jgi:hypothetical protein
MGSPDHTHIEPPHELCCQKTVAEFSPRVLDGCAEVQPLQDEKCACHKQRSRSASTLLLLPQEHTSYNAFEMQHEKARIQDHQELFCVPEQSARHLC